ncbi:hypothetical protein EPUL_005857, partial [Erysiphe pulchra]
MSGKGLIICHILLGINIASETQSSCFVLVEKLQYQGSCLLGAKYATFANSRWFAADTKENFRHTLARIDPHESAVDDMTKVLAQLTANSPFSGSMERKVFGDPQLLVNELSTLKLDEIEEDDIRELDRCRISNKESTNGNRSEIRLQEPTFISSIRSPFSSDIFKLLSRFGPEAPSFWNDRGSEILCRAREKSVITTGGKRKMGEADLYMNMPSKIMIISKPLLIAVKDLEKVVEKGKVKMDINERAGRYRHVSIEHYETKRKLWKELVILYSSSDKKKKIDDRKNNDSNVDLDELCP